MAWVREVSCSGDALVVVDTERARKALRDRLCDEQRPPPPFRFEGGEYALKVKRISQTEPQAILWEGFSREAKVRQILRMVACVCLVLLAIMVFLLLYIPYALYYAGLIEVPGVSPSFMQDFLLGLLIGVGNVIVGNIIDMTASTASFQTKDGK